MKKCAVILILVFANALVAHSQTLECPVNMVCISPEAARKALENADLVEAQKKEIASLSQAIEDYKALIVSTKIELAKAVGEKTGCESGAVRSNAIIDALLKKRQVKVGLINF